MKFLKKILLVDHEPRITLLVRRALEGTGKYLVKVEQDCQLALHAAPWFLPDLVLLDAEKAEAEGEDVNRWLKSDPALRDTPFLFLGGQDCSGEKVLTGGFISGYRFVATSTSLDDLIRCVDEMLCPGSSSPSSGSTGENCGAV